MTAQQAIIGLQRAAASKGPLVNGARIKQLREEHALSQAELAEKIGSTEKTVGQWETEPEKRIRSESLKALAKFFNVLPKELIYSVGPPRFALQNTDVRDINIHIVESAKEFLYTTGSRSRDGRYLDAIEETLRKNADLVHCRVLFGPPMKQKLKVHLKNLLAIRETRNSGEADIDPLCIAVYQNAATYPAEAAICMNETMALMVLPSASGASKYDTALIVEDRGMITGWRTWVETMIANGQRLSSVGDIEELGCVEK